MHDRGKLAADRWNEPHGDLKDTPESDLLALFSTVGRVVGERCPTKRPALNSWPPVRDALETKKELDPSRSAGKHQALRQFHRRLLPFQ
jgi:hypothetical protein